MSELESFGWMVLVIFIVLILFRGVNRNKDPNERNGAV